MKYENDGDRAALRRLLIMGSGSVLLHGVIVAIIIFAGMGSAKETVVYRVQVRHLQPKTEPVEVVKETIVAEPEQKEEIVPPKTIDLTAVAPISLAAAVELEQLAQEMDMLPPLLTDDTVVLLDVTSGSGSDDSYGLPMMASSVERGWGGSASGDGWGGGSGSGSGTGVGYGDGGSGLGRTRGGEGDSAGGYFAGMPGIIPPGYENTPQPRYPAAAKARGEQGNILLKVEVLANGRVGLAEMAQSSGYELLDESALEAIKRWRFKPAMRGRETVACWVNIPIKFELR